MSETTKISSSVLLGKHAYEFCLKTGSTAGGQRIGECIVEGMDTAIMSYSEQFEYDGQPEVSRKEAKNTYYPVVNSEIIKIGNEFKSKTNGKVDLDALLSSYVMFFGAYRNGCRPVGPDVSDSTYKLEENGISELELREVVPTCGELEAWDANLRTRIKSVFQTTSQRVGRNMVQLAYSTGPGEVDELPHRSVYDSDGAYTNHLFQIGAYFPVAGGRALGFLSDGGPAASLAYQVWSGDERTLGSQQRALSLEGGWKQNFYSRSLGLFGIKAYLSASAGAGRAEASLNFGQGYLPEPSASWIWSGRGGVGLDICSQDLGCFGLGFGAQYSRSIMSSGSEYETFRWLPSAGLSVYLPSGKKGSKLKRKYWLRRIYG